MNKYFREIPKDEQWDSYSIRLLPSKGKEVFMKNTRPVIDWYGAAIAKYEDEWHVLDEDDQHYWTHCILTDEQLIDAHRMFIELNTRVTVHNHGKRISRSYSFKDQSIPKIKSKHFSFHYDFKGKQLEKIIMTFPNGEPLWIWPNNIKNMINCFGLKENN